MNLVEYLSEAIAKGKSGKYSDWSVYSVLADHKKLTPEVAKEVFQEIGFKMVSEPIYAKRELQMTSSVIGHLIDIQLVFTDQTYVRMYFSSNDNRLMSIHFFLRNGNMDDDYEVKDTQKFSIIEVKTIQLHELVHKLSDEGVL